MHSIWWYLDVIWCNKSGVPSLSMPFSAQAEHHPLWLRKVPAPRTAPRPFI